VIAEFGKTSSDSPHRSANIVVPQRAIARLLKTNLNWSDFVNFKAGGIGWRGTEERGARDLSAVCESKVYALQKGTKPLKYSEHRSFMVSDYRQKRASMILESLERRWTQRHAKSFDC
jgi:hypothetical protein